MKIKPDPGYCLQIENRILFLKFKWI